MKNFYIPSQFLNSIFGKRLISSTSVKKMENNQVKILENIQKLLSPTTKNMIGDANDVLNSVLKLSPAERSAIIAQVTAHTKECTKKLLDMPSDHPNRSAIYAMRNLHLATSQWLKQLSRSQALPMQPLQNPTLAESAGSSSHQVIPGSAKESSSKDQIRESTIEDFFRRKFQSSEGRNQELQQIKESLPLRTVSDLEVFKHHAQEEISKLPHQESQNQISPQQASNLRLYYSEILNGCSAELVKKQGQFQSLPLPISESPASASSNSEQSFQASILHQATKNIFTGVQRVGQSMETQKHLEVFGQQDASKLGEKVNQDQEKVQQVQVQQSYGFFKDYIDKNKLSGLLNNDALSLPAARHSLFLDTTGISLVKSLKLETKRFFNFIFQKGRNQNLEFKDDVTLESIRMVSIPRILGVPEVTKEIQSRQLVGKLASQYTFDKLQQRIEESHNQGILLKNEEIHSLIETLQQDFSNIVNAHTNTLLNALEIRTPTSVVYQLGYADREAILRLYKKLTHRENRGMEFGRFRAFLEANKNYQSSPNIFPVDSSLVYKLLQTEEQDLYIFFQKNGNHQKVFELFANFYNHRYQILKETASRESHELMKDLLASLHLVNLCKNYQLSPTQSREFFENFDVSYLESFANFVHEQVLEVKPTRQELGERYNSRRKSTSDVEASSSGQHLLKSTSELQTQAQQKFPILDQKPEKIQKDVGKIQDTSDFGDKFRQWFTKWTD